MSERNKFSARCALGFMAVVVGGGLTRAAAPSSQMEADGWKSVAQREEIRPAFDFKRDGGPDKRGSLIIRADDREGLDGHWIKTFSITGSQYYRFRALRRLENVGLPRRSVVARILWRDDHGNPVRHDEPGAKSFAPNELPLAEPEYPSDRETDA